MKGQDVHWKQGVFIQPHHFQQAFLHQDHARADLLRDYIPFFEGVGILKISESACEQFSFEIERLDCRMPDGTRLVFSSDSNGFSNTQISPKSFKDALLSPENRGALDVYIGLPRHRDDGNFLTEAGSHRRRYVVEDVEVPDMVSGEPARIETRQLHAEILLSSEPRAGYSLLPIARVVHRAGEIGDKASFDDAFVPPCISINGSTHLYEIFKEIGNRLQNKNELMRDFWQRKDVAEVMRSRDTFKVQTLAVAAKTYQQLSALGDRLHPYQLYLKMSEIIAMLSIYTDDDDLLDLPDYDHFDQAFCFNFVHNSLTKILEQLEELPYHKVTFRLSGETHDCRVDPAWYNSDEYDFYVCFESTDDEREVTRAVRRLKVAPTQSLAELNRLRLRGIALDGPRHQISQLPTSPKHHYFLIPKDDEVFSELTESWVLSVWGDVEFSQNHSLYVVKTKG